MAVFTSVQRAELVGFLDRYAAGTLQDYRGISTGVANTNYFVTTSSGEYVLTLFELLATEEIPYFLDLANHLADRGLPCARALRDRDGEFLGQLHDRPAALVQRLPGASVGQPDLEHCAAIGATLARLHLAARDFPQTRPNPHGLDWAVAVAGRLAPRLPTTERDLLEDELAYQHGRDCGGLPQGLIHADLFRDNVLFLDHHISGVIDFYFACNDCWLLDLAITVNDWCVDDAGTMDRRRSDALVQAYARERPLHEDEQVAWQDMLRRAALRFWLSRLEDYHSPRSGEITVSKDPAAFRQRLEQHRQV